MKIDLIEDGDGLLKAIIIPEKDFYIILTTFRQMDYILSIYC